MIDCSPYVGRMFNHGTQDCYSLLRDFYRDTYDIELRDYARPDCWWDTGLDLYNRHFSDEGFVALELTPRQFQEGDVLLMAIKSDVANHCAIYVGQGQILHHPYGRPSLVERYRFFRATTHTLRHRLLMDKEKIVETVHLFDYIPYHKRKILE